MTTTYELAEQQLIDLVMTEYTYLDTLSEQGASAQAAKNEFLDVIILLSSSAVLFSGVTENDKVLNFMSALKREITAYYYTGQDTTVSSKKNSIEVRFLTTMASLANKFSIRLCKDDWWALFHSIAAPKGVIDDLDSRDAGLTPVIIVMTAILQNRKVYLNLISSKIYKVSNRDEGITTVTATL